MATTKKNTVASKKGIATLTITEATQKKIKVYCKKKGYKLSPFSDAALLFALQNDLTL